MRYPEGHKAAVRARIVDAASRALRRDGLAGVSIPALMKGAGLTHGGFYAHFADRDALVAEAVEHAAAETGERVFEAAPDLAAAVSAYVSAAHADNPEHGCVVAALGGEGPRQSTPVRAAFARTARGLIALIDQKAGGSGCPTDETLALAAQMVGSIVLARLVDDPELARRLLASAS